MWGTRYQCYSCSNFDLCFKCYVWKDTLHDLPGHDFEDRGLEYESDIQESSNRDNNEDDVEYDQDDDDLDTDDGDEYSEEEEDEE